MPNFFGIAKNLGVKYNVCIRVMDEITGKVVSEHVGHNAATATLLTGIGQFLMGEAIIAGNALLADWIPQYISLGTMGLRNQEEDEKGLPAGIGDKSGVTDEEELFKDYMLKVPGFGADGSDNYLNNGRDYFGLGPAFNTEDRPYEGKPVGCELVSNTFPRAKIAYRRCLPESESEIPQTIDVLYSALITTGALAQFREPGKDYIFVSEVGLWSSYKSDPDNLGYGLLAGYRICPPDKENWDMSVAENRKKLKESILRVGTNQVVQVIWKIQLGAVEQIIESGGYVDPEWHVVD